MPEKSTGCPFLLPLDREQFAAALRKGQGRALMQVMQHGVTGFEDVVIDACLHDRRYDRQCESDRTPWIMRVVDAAKLTQPAGEAVVTALARESGPGWSEEAHHLCRMAGRLATNGYPAARSALYAAFQRDDEPPYPMAGYEIVELDGAEGLILVAEKIGRWLASDPTIDVAYGPMYAFDELHGDGSAERYLETVAATNELVASVLDALRHSRARVDGTTRSDRIAALSAAEFIQEIELNAPNLRKWVGRGWSRSASQDDLRLVADRMFQESDPVRLVLFLRVFARRPLPDFDARLPQWAHHANEDVRRAANQALAQYRHPDVRALALSQVSAGTVHERQLLLLSKNYLAGDWSRIQHLLQKTHDLDDLHDLLMDLLDIYASNPAEEAREPMLAVYERTPCAICRGSSVKVLIETGQAPAWLLEECQFDGDDYGREAIAKKGMNAESGGQC